MKKIVHLLTYLDTQTGGMERQAMQLAKKLRERGYEAFFVTCAHRDKMKKEGLAQKDILEGFRVFRIPFFAGWARLNALLYLLGSSFLLFRLRNEYDIIHAHQLWTSGIVACVAKMIMREKIVIIKNCSGGEIGDIRQMKKFPFSKFFLFFLKKKTDAFIAVSSETLKEMRSVGYTAIRQISNGVDTVKFAPLGAQERARVRGELFPEHADKKIVLFVGRLFPKKRVSVLIRAVAKQERDVILAVVGDGPLRSDLEGEVRTGHWEDKIIFMGERNNIHKYYQVADVFVLPSRNEGMPNSLLEAMSAGVPSIGSDIESITPIIDDGKNGLIFSLDNVDQLVEKLRIVCESDEMRVRLSRCARATIENTYSFEHIVEQYSNLYDEL